MLHRLDWLRSVAGALSVAVLFLTKMSAPLFLLSAAILAGIHVFSEEPITVKFGGFKKIVASRCQKAITVFGSTTAIGAFVILSIWTCFAFRFSAVAENGQIRQTFSEHWDALLEEHGPAQTAIAFVRAHRLLPEGYLYGLAFVYKSAQQRPSFLDGEWSETGFSSFFPRAFFYKTSLPVFLLGLLAVAAAGLRWRLAMPRDRWKTIANHLRLFSPVATLLLIHGAVALASKLNIGHRHLLPIYPAIFVTCGAVSIFSKTEDIAHSLLQSR